MIERAELIDFDDTTWTATVRPARSLGGVLSGVPVSRAIADTELVSGRRVALARFAAGNPHDAMIVGVY